MESVEPAVVVEGDLDREVWDDEVKGVLSFRTLFSSDTTATRSLTTGVGELAPGGWLGLHRHTPAETYYVLEGRGVVVLEGVEHEVGPGTSVFIPGNAEHGVRASPDQPLRIFYAFAVDSLDEVTYRFSA